MTQRSRWALEDCKAALNELEENTDVFAWRRKWVSFISLARLVLHVLEKVDSKSDPALECRVKSWWHELKNDKANNPIFWQFIDTERNSLLKQYSTNAYFQTSERICWATRERTVEHSSKFTEGFYTGRDTLEVAKEAVTWLEQQLTILEQSPTKHS